MLTTLVNRHGIPRHATNDPARVQANGQCFLVRRDVLAEAGGFGDVLDSVSEDVILARIIAADGHRVGFYETAREELVRVAMYVNAGEAWRNWLRSLPMRDRFWGVPGWLGLAEVVLVQAAPLPLAILSGRRSGMAGLLGHANLALLVMRLGVLAGTARTYVHRPWTYWLSPVCDLPVALGVLFSAMRRVHSWRGQPLVRGESRCSSPESSSSRTSRRSPSAWPGCSTSFPIRPASPPTRARCRSTRSECNMPGRCTSSSARRRCSPTGSPHSASAEPASSSPSPSPTRSSLR